MEEWVYSIQQDCAYENIPFFFKQWGDNSKFYGDKIDNKLYHNYPKFGVQS